MSDPFHQQVSDALLLEFFRTVHMASWHQWQVLTKRHDRMLAFMSRLFVRDGLLELSDTPLPSEEQATIQNLWLGVTAGTQRSANLRLPALLGVRAGVRFVSVEPMLEAVDLDPHVAGLDWIIVGGESAGPDGVFRPMEMAWARRVRDVAVSHDVAFFYKQAAGKDPNRLPKDLDGQMWRQLPWRELPPIPDDSTRRTMAGRMWAVSHRLPR